MNSNIAYSNMVDELCDYLSKRGGTLLIKGRPGSGKTTLALHFLKEVGGGAGVYFSSRVSDEALRKQFKDMDKAVTPEKFIDTRLGLAESFLEQLFSAIRSKPPIVVLDSWDAYAKKMSETERLKTEEVLITLASASDSSLVFVAESVENTNLDFLVDAVVEMKVGELDGRLIREIVTHKLRGKPIWRNHELVSLHGAKINTLVVYSTPNFSKSKLTADTRDPKDAFSLGTRELDELFGGVRRGSIFLIEISAEAPFELGESIAMGCVLNQIVQGRRAIIVPPSGVDPVMFLRKYESAIPWETLKDSVRMLVFESFGGMPLEGFPTTSSETPVKRLSVKDPKQLPSQMFRLWGGAKKRSKDGGVIGFVDVSQFETTFASDMNSVVEILAESVSRLSILRDSAIFIVREHSGLKQTIQSISDVHIKITAKHGVALMYGVKPHTVIHWLNYYQNPVKPTIIPVI